MTLYGTVRIKGSVPQAIHSGSRTRGYTVTLGSPMSSGCLAVSGYCSCQFVLHPPNAEENKSEPMRDQLTLEPNNINLSPMFRNTNSVVLHARTPPNISHHENLDVLIGRVGGGTVGCWFQSGDATTQPEDECETVAECDDEDHARKDGQHKGGHHGSRCRPEVGPWCRRG